MKQPINLNLRTMHFPAMAIASILHRLSGLILFLLLPCMLYAIELSLYNQESFAHLYLRFKEPGAKLLILVGVVALTYHSLAGIRHILLDLGIGEGLKTARISAIFIMLFTAIIMVLFGLWI